MSCQEIRIILDGHFFKFIYGINTFLWGISMDIVCQTFSSFSLLRGLPGLDGKNEFLCEKEDKAVSPTQLNSDRL